MNNTKIDEEVKKGDVSYSTLYNSMAVSFAEDVNQPLAVLLESGIPTHEIIIDEIQVGEPGVPRTDDQEKLR